MKNVNSMKSTGKIESPKTPGGISKSLLTPCRRLGLSRSWRKSGPSPFISPLSNTPRTVTETKQESVTKKRKTKDSPERDNEDADVTNISLKNSNVDTEVDSRTPTRTNLNRKRCKTLILTENSQESECPIENPPHKENLENVISEELSKITKVSKLSRQHSKSKDSKSSHSQIIKPNEIESNTIESNSPQIPELKKVNTKKSPQNLTTECMIVLQKKIIDKPNKPIVRNKPEVCPTPSQALFDSDSDDVPLCQINKKPKTDTLLNSECNKIDKDKKPSKDSLPSNNFDENSKVTKLEDKKTSTTDLKIGTKKTKSSKKLNTEKNSKLEKIPSSQSSNSLDDDDDDFDFKRTIIIKKSYDKVTKPEKAKSTGSITEKDINDLKARIEAKKKLLLAKALDSDTEDLRGLIKKWQKGCQDALVELVDLMKKKMPEQTSMDNSQILQMLKIPPDLVGYDVENDCFNPPNDTKIVLSSLKIL